MVYNTIQIIAPLAVNAELFLLLFQAHPSHTYQKKVLKKGILRHYWTGCHDSGLSGPGHPNKPAISKTGSRQDDGVELEGHG
jgi:hypothetical protein